MSLRLCAVILSSLAFTGCASVMNEVNQPIKVETMSAAGAAVPGAECKLTNDYGVTPVKSGDTAMVHRSNKDLDITCVHPKNPDAVARAISRVNGSMFGNIILGGGIGAVVDHNRGTAYSYPTWVQLVFGKTMVFDRSAETAGKPVVGVDTATATAAAASAAN